MLKGYWKGRNHVETQLYLSGHHMSVYSTRETPWPWLGRLVYFNFHLIPFFQRSERLGALPIGRYTPRPTCPGHRLDQ